MLKTEFFKIEPDFGFKISKNHTKTNKKQKNKEKIKIFVLTFLNYCGKISAKGYENQIKQNFSVRRMLKWLMNIKSKNRYAKSVSVSMIGEWLLLTMVTFP